mgnify:CR=1 FL=1
MNQRIKITDLRDPRLDIYARLSEVQLLRYAEPAPGIFIGESPKVIRRALVAGYKPISFLVADLDLDREALEILEQWQEIPVYTAEEAVLRKLTGFAMTRGMLCGMQRKALPAVEDICRDARRIAILENVVNPTNVGAIFRSAAALHMDAVLLTGFAHARERDTMLDLGTGTGIIPLLMEAKYHCSHLTGLEIQEESADMARRSVALNDLQDRIDIVTGDIKEADQIFPAASFDCITCNPPYMIGQHGLTNPEEPKAIARHEVLCTLEDVVSRTAKLLKPGGHFYMVHRPFRLAEIMTMLVKYKLEPKRMQLVYPYIDKEPNMVLIEAVRGGRSRMTVEKPLIVYQAPGVYMPEIYDIYGY